MALLPYVGSVINLGNSFSQATRPRNVGQMSDLIQEYRETAENPSVDGWESFYSDRIGLDKIDGAVDKIWEYVQRIKNNLESLERDDVYAWTKDLIINKTFSGLQLQLDILEMVSDTGDYRLSTPEEEAKGIDGFVDGEPVSIKPNTYKKTIEAGKESIPYRIIYYKNTKNGLVVAWKGGRAKRPYSMSITFAQISEMDTVEINRSIMELNFRKEKLQREMDGIQATIEHLVAQRTLIQMPDDVRSGQALFDEMFGGWFYSPDPSKIDCNAMQTVTVPISVLETLIKGLQGAVDVCYNVDNKEEETEKSYPYAVGFSQSTMKWIIKDLQRLKQVPN